MMLVALLHADYGASCLYRSKTGSILEEVKKTQK